MGAIVGGGVGCRESRGQVTDLVWDWGLEHTGMTFARCADHLDCVPAHVMLPPMEWEHDKCGSMTNGAL